MCSTPKSGNAMVLLESGNTFYLWEQIGDEVYRIDDPSTENAIIQAIKENGLKGLTMVPIQPSEEAS